MYVLAVNKPCFSCGMQVLPCSQMPRYATLITNAQKPETTLTEEDRVKYISGIRYPELLTLCRALAKQQRNIT